MMASGKARLFSVRTASIWFIWFGWAINGLSSLMVKRGNNMVALSSLLCGAERLSLIPLSVSITLR